jgi:hypothetical protein
MRTLLSVSPKGPKFRRNEISSGKIGLGGKIGGPLGAIGLGGSPGTRKSKLVFIGSVGTAGKLIRK